MKKEIKLIALDLDGTLYNNDGKISQKNKDALKRARENHTAIVISTGRPYVGLPLEEMKEIGMEYAITANGAAVYHIPDKKCLYEDAITANEGAALLRKLFQHTFHLDAFINGSAYTQASTRPLIDRLQIPVSLRAYIKNTRNIVDDLAGFVSSNNLSIQKLTLNFIRDKDGVLIDRAKIAALLDEYSGFHYLSGGFENLEINKAGVSKAKGLRFLCDALNIPLSQTLACGDSENDLDIVTAAGVGVAMANAQQILLDAADFVTLSNEDDGVAYAIETLTETAAG